MYCCPNVKSSECKLIRIEKGNDVWRAVAKQTDSVCVTWMWANVFSGYPIVPRMHGHATMGIAPQAVLLNPGLHCAFKQSRALGIDACNKTHVEAILEVRLPSEDESRRASESRSTPGSERFIRERASRAPLPAQNALFARSLRHSPA